MDLRNVSDNNSRVSIVTGMAVADEKEEKQLLQYSRRLMPEENDSPDRLL